MSGKYCISFLGGSLEGVAKVREEDGGDILAVVVLRASFGVCVEAGLIARLDMRRDELLRNADEVLENIGTMGCRRGRGKSLSMSAAGLYGVLGILDANGIWARGKRN